MPGKEPQTSSLGGNDYTVHPHGAIKGRSVLLRLAKLLGPGLAGGGGLTTAGIGAKVAALLENVEEQDLTYLCDEFGPKTTVRTPDGGEIQLSKIFDVHFQDNYLELLQWLKFAVEVNFGSFFRGAGAAIKDVAKSAASAATAKAPDA